MVANLQRRLRGGTDRWLFKMAVSERGEVLLTRRRVFILPTSAGLFFFVLLLLLLIGATNYNLSLGFALAFTMAVCGIVDMVMTYKNLVQLHLLAGRAHPVFAGEVAQFEVMVINRSPSDRYALHVDFQHEAQARYVADAAAGSNATLLLSVPTTERGWMKAPRIKLSTRFPMGLCNAWSYWQPDAKVLVYPFPEEDAPALPMSGAAAEDGHGHAGHDDFAGIRSYQAGDPLRHLAWRQIARLEPDMGGQLVTKHFEGGAVEELTLDFDAMPASDALELRLSRMTRWVLNAEQRALPYAFRKNGRQFAASVGAAHQAACLRALALHGREDA